MDADISEIMKRRRLMHVLFDRVHAKRAFERFIRDAARQKYFPCYKQMRYVICKD